MRRRDLLPLLLLLPAAPALAQQRSRTAGKPPALDLPKSPAQPPAGKSAQAPRSSHAPVPDRTKEGPRVVEEDRARINPSIINRNMPGRGQAQEGSPDLLEDKLFRPAPGVRLNAPFSY
ncbi:hypothetical protein [Roseicella aerolata]|uniref:Uncharacterized protein n=1 Tax=Roseicella aerolata TaxID=2883479 RepID=A0A9X1IHF1_9PROT|nr:hypothetical protein [Roseicella aerolata]MCB4824704.1 hypothetical protein [Roseicella aerolata]